MTFYLENITALVANIGLTLGLVGRRGGGITPHRSKMETCSKTLFLVRIAWLHM